MTISELVKAAHDNAVAKGFWPPIRLDAKSEAEKLGLALALIHSEVSEALEELRSGAIVSATLVSGKPVGFGSELADIVIRVADLAGAVGIDLEGEIERKHAYNLTRPYKHSKAF